MNLQPPVLFTYFARFTKGAGQSESSRSVDMFAFVLGLFTQVVAYGPLFILFRPTSHSEFQLSRDNATRLSGQPQSVVDIRLVS